uniref:Uncharacterized protein n=1 Tax=Rhizophagus irregularis (strain DAOM 181602 / DAOM 197198 / MUCL 43194) TaxID=747089 RepID=U9SXS9_RHIID
MQHQYSIINISSIEWIRLQFWPTNPTSTRAMHYNGQFNIKYQIQARQLPDDKHKVLIGEGAATSTAVIDVPTIIEDSFYYGNVFVSYKDTVFQPSNANRRATAFFNAIQTHYISHIPPILCLYTDNGHTTFGSVQISLICLFLHSDFDMLIALQEIRAAAAKNEDLKKWIT